MKTVMVPRADEISRQRFWAQVWNQLLRTRGNFSAKDQLRGLVGGRSWLEVVPREYSQTKISQYMQHIRQRAVHIPIKDDKHLRRLIAQDLRRNIADSTKRNIAERIIFAVTACEHMAYHQGMDYLLAGMLNGACSLREEQMYSLFVFTLTNMHLHGFYLINTNAFLVDYTAEFMIAFKFFLPALHAHFEAESFEPIFYLVDWFSTMFLRCRGPALSQLTLDLLYAGVEEPLFRVALAILEMLEPQLLFLSFEQLGSLSHRQSLRNLVMTLDDGCIIATALTFDFGTLEKGAFATLHASGVGVLAQLNKRHRGAFAKARFSHFARTVEQRVRASVRASSGSSFAPGHGSPASPPAALPASQDNYSPEVSGEGDNKELSQFNKLVGDDIQKWKVRVEEERIKLQRLREYKSNFSEEERGTPQRTVELPAPRTAGSADGSSISPISSSSSSSSGRVVSSIVPSNGRRRLPMSAVILVKDHTVRSSNHNSKHQLEANGDNGGCAVGDNTAQ
jgi:hypothetical protein